MVCESRHAVVKRVRPLDIREINLQSVWLNLVTSTFNLKITVILKNNNKNYFISK